MGKGRTILIADGDAESRAAMSEAFQRAGYVTTEVESGAKALAAVRRSRPALVVLDVHLPGISGYEVCHELREEYGELIPLIFVSGTRTEATDRVAGLLVGADDYLVKPFEPDELLARARRLIARAAARDVPAHVAGSTLTNREREVLTLLADGIQSGEIALRLFISPKTVATHIQRILTKLGVHSRAEAVARAHRERLLVDEVDAHSLFVGAGPNVSAAERQRGDLRLTGVRHPHEPDLRFGKTGVRHPSGA